MLYMGSEFYELQNKAHSKTSQDPWNQCTRADLWISIKLVYAAATKVSATSPCDTEEIKWKGLATPQ